MHLIGVNYDEIFNSNLLNQNFMANKLECDFLEEKKNLNLHEHISKSHAYGLFYPITLYYHEI